MSTMRSHKPLWMEKLYHTSLEKVIDGRIILCDVFLWDYYEMKYSLKITCH